MAPTDMQPPGTTRLKVKAKEFGCRELLLAAVKQLDVESGQTIGPSTYQTRYGHYLGDRQLLNESKKKKESQKRLHFDLFSREVLPLGHSLISQ
jgi:hypothetical protein